jgi:MerR family transcriptional regulator, light-induced transcriptional regulator
MNAEKIDLYLSPASFAEALGLSVSTLKRWTDKGILQVERTAGGHRRIAMREALRFVRDSGLRPVMPHRLGLVGVDEADAGAAADARFGNLLLAGKCDEARKLLISAFVSGVDVATLGDDWLRPAFEKLGDLWKHSTMGIAIEHEATDAALRAIAEMRALIEPPETGPTAVGGAVARDPYLLPTALVGLLLSVDGFRATSLGADLPRGALVSIAERFRPRLVWMSVSVSDASEAKRPALEALAAEVAKHGAAVAIGGRAAPDRVKGATVCRDLAGLTAFARGLLA